MRAQIKNTGVHIGTFYENKRTGTILKCIGWVNGRASLYPENRPRQRVKHQSVTPEELSSKFRHRPDLKDWPNAWNPLLPYVFDLNWDMKCESDLVRECIESGHSEEYDRILVENGLQPVGPRLGSLAFKYGIESWHGL